MKTAKELKYYIQSKSLNEVVSISDIEMKDFEGNELNNEEKKALEIFRKLRMEKLSNTRSQENKFHEKFEYLKVISNVIDYRDILSGEISI